jgi:hypothetical protein
MDSNVRYVNNLGAHLIKSVKLTYGTVTLAHYKFCPNCKEQYEVTWNVDEEFDKLYREIKGIPRDAPKDWCRNCLSASKSLTGFRRNSERKEEI